MFFQFVALLACFAAGVLQLLAVRKPFGDQPILRVARRMTAVTMFMSCLYIIYDLKYYGSANPVVCWLLGVIALSQILFSMHTFMEPECATRLILPKGTSDEASHA